MSGIHTSVAPTAHGYTRSNTPWILNDDQTIYGRLVHYLSGGGLRTFGRTVKQEQTRMRQRRFLTWAGVIGFVWLVFYVG